MTLADELFDVVYEGRAIAGGEGFRPHTVALVRTASTGPHTGDGIQVESLIPITEANGQPPRVRQLKDDEIAVGQLQPGTLEIGSITPAFPGGGTDLSDLAGRNLTTGETRYLKITGPLFPTGALCRIVSLRADRTLRYVIRAVPVSQ